MLKVIKLHKQIEQEADKAELGFDSSFDTSILVLAQIIHNCFSKEVK